MQDFGLENEVVWTIPEEEIAASLGDSAKVPQTMDPLIEEDGADPEVDLDLLASIENPAATSGEPIPDSSGLDGMGGGPFEWKPAGFADSPKPFEEHHWSVPWSDLMMVMFVMFAVITTTQLAPPEEAETQEIATRDRIVRPFGDPIMTINVMERAQRVVKDSEAQDVDIVLMEDQSVKVSVQGPMLFNAGSADLRPETNDFLDRLAAIIRETPYLIEVVGHTDDLPVTTPRFPSNWELSTARASRVARYLIQSGRLAPSRFTVIGRAEYDPVSGNQTVAQRSRNRRVEILITRDVLPSSEVAVNE